MKTLLVGNTHLVVGGPETVADVLTLLRREGIETRGNPDMYVRIYRHFGIYEARELRERAALRPLGIDPPLLLLRRRLRTDAVKLRRAQRVFVIATPDMNREAQNALLKTIEEPPGNAFFFFILPSPEGLLPTFRSRAHMLAVERERDARADTKAFLAAAPQERLEMLKPLLEKGDDDKRDLGAILSFLASLEKSMQKNVEGLSAASREGLESVYRARK